MDTDCATASHIAPLFFSFAQRKTSQTPPLTLHFSTISIQNRHFEKSMAQTINTNQVRYGDGNTNCPNINNSYNTNTNIYQSDEDAAIMRWLSPLEPNNRHQSVRNSRYDGVGDWLLEMNEFQKWRSCEGGADQAAVFSSGNPGVGKTFLR